LAFRKFPYPTEISQTNRLPTENRKVKTTTKAEKELNKTVVAFKRVNRKTI